MWKRACLKECAAWPVGRGRFEGGDSGMVNDVGSRDDAAGARGGRVWMVWYGNAACAKGCGRGRRAFFPPYSCDVSVAGAGTSANVLLIHAEFIETERGFMV